MPMSSVIAFEDRERKESRKLLVGLCIFLGVMLGFPVIVNLWYGFADASFENLTGSFIGLENYRDALSNPKMWQALGFSLRFALICTLFEVGIALVLVFILHPLLVTRPWLTAVLMLPMMVSPALMGVMYRLILNEFTGIVPVYLEMAGMAVNFLGRRSIYNTVVAIEVLQWTPFAFLILATARQTVAYEIEEAGAVDGATGWHAIFHIFLPLMRPAIVIVLFVRFIDSFRVFDHIYVLTGGGPGNLTTSISIYIYKLFFVQRTIGEAVAVSTLLLIMSLTLIVLAMRLVVRRN
jgi:multiple sugar transport system permease protein